jgi:hypothetical protein
MTGKVFGVFCEQEEIEKKQIPVTKAAMQHIRVNILGVINHHGD